MDNGVPSWWTEARTEELKTRWANGETGTQICLAMHASSRSAVVGKIYRLKLAPRERANGAHGVRRPRRGSRNGLGLHRRCALYSGENVSEEPPVIFKAAKRFIELDYSDCRWPSSGVPGPDLLCCAAPALKGRPYCAAHCRIAFAGAPRPKAPRS